jgi:HD-GYP domain-containing protein (c-di-GMP phosphodiesterase class II)
MLTIISGLVIMSLGISRLVSRNAIKQIEEYTDKTNTLLTSLNHEIAERKTAEGKLQRAHDELEKRVQERTRKLSETVTVLNEEIAKRKVAEKLNQKRIDHLSALRSIQRAITSRKDLHVTLDILLDQVTSQLAIDAASILLLNQHTQIMEYVTNKGFRTKALKYTKLKIGESYAGRAAIERSIVNISNLKEEPGKFIRSELFPEEDFITYFAVPLIVKGQVKGILELFHRSIRNVTPDWVDFLENIANEAAIAIDDTSLFEDLQRSRAEIITAYDTTIEGWSRALDYRDKETEGHSRRVTDLTLTISKAMGISDADLVNIRYGALLHDIGKLGVPDGILLKPGKLTDEEWIIMKRHPEIAYTLLSPIPYLRSALLIPYCHHEKLDGTGYPRGLKGEEIPLSARIFAVVDVWDAIRSDRPYSRAFTKDKAIDHIKSVSGTHFDPKVVEVFLKMEL